MSAFFMIYNKNSNRGIGKLNIYSKKQYIWVRSGQMKLKYFFKRKKN